MSKVKFVKISKTEFKENIKKEQEGFKQQTLFESGYQLNPEQFYKTPQKCRLLPISTPDTIFTNTNYSNMSVNEHKKTSVSRFLFSQHSEENFPEACFEVNQIQDILKSPETRNFESFDLELQENQNEKKMQTEERLLRSSLIRRSSRLAEKRMKTIESSLQKEKLSLYQKILNEKDKINNEGLFELPKIQI